jgi:hypothetical protein
MHSLAQRSGGSLRLRSVHRLSVVEVLSAPAHRSDALARASATIPHAKKGKRTSVRCGSLPVCLPVWNPPLMRALKSGRFRLAKDKRIVALIDYCSYEFQAQRIKGTKTQKLYIQSKVKTKLF